MRDEFDGVDLFGIHATDPGPGPDTMTLRVCTACGRNDRHLSLNRFGSHYTKGEKCRGRVVDVTYRRAS